jgi:serine/threonine protein kinase
MDAARQREREASARVGTLVAGKYRLISVLGVGGMGAVFAAVHQLTERKVALKLLHPHLAGEVNVQRFLQEAKASALIEHPRVAQVLDAGEVEGGSLYLAMEHLQGEDLGARIRAGGTPPALMLEVGIQVLEALEAAHAKRLIHRDIKPANLFLVRTPDGAVDARVLDFGVARRLDPAARRLTQAGGVVGTPYFMSPEQMCGEAVDGRADLWALGVVLYYGLAGFLPFRNESYVDLLKDMLRSGPPDLCVAQPELDPRLAAAVEVALAPKLEDRYPDAPSMRAALVALRSTRLERLEQATLRIAEREARTALVTPRPPPAAPAPRWAGALDALDHESEALEGKRPAPPAPPPPRGWWPFGKKG